MIVRDSPLMTGPSSASQTPRPSMRRKSSAQTLLSSFKSGNNSSNVPTTAPATQLTMQIPPALNSGLGNYGGGTSTPISTTQREWDAQSMKSDSITSSTALNQGGANGSPAIPQGTSLESLRDLTMKRMITLTYLRNVHEGYVRLCIPNFNRLKLLADEVIGSTPL